MILYFKYFVYVKYCLFDSNQMKKSKEIQFKLKKIQIFFAASKCQKKRNSYNNINHNNKISVGIHKYMYTYTRYIHVLCVHIKICIHTQERRGKKRITNGKILNLCTQSECKCSVYMLFGISKPIDINEQQQHHHHQQLHKKRNEIHIAVRFYDCAGFVSLSRLTLLLHIIRRVIVFSLLFLYSVPLFTENIQYYIFIYIYYMYLYIQINECVSVSV